MRPVTLCGPRPRTRGGIVKMVDRGWCNGSTGSFGVPGRGSMPRPRARGPQPHATPRARQEVSAMTQYRPLSAVVLAAGEGTRMRSETPKVLHPLCGRPMLLHVIDALVALPLERIVVVVGHGAERVTKTLQEQLATELPVEFVEQRVQRGTGDAASVALTAGVFDLDAEDDLLVVPGDAPLLRAETLATLARAHREAGAAATVLTAILHPATGYGRVVRDDSGGVDRIVEDADATPDELEIAEINTSIYCFRRGLLAPALRRLSPENAQGEYYLPDAVSVLRETGHAVVGVVADDPDETAGVNDRAQLAEVEAALRRRINRRWMRDGVSMTDPERTYVDATVELEPDVHLLPGTMLEGRTVVGARSVIGPDARLTDTIVGEGAVVRQTVAHEVEIGDDATVGPYVFLRPGTRLAARAHVGTFVEIKNSDIGEGAKVPHLAYIGDAEIGDGANIGAGTITANYDGREKHRMLFAGRGNEQLSKEIAEHLKVPLGEIVLSTFANGELYCRFGESIRGADVFILQSHCEPINERIMEQLLMLDAAKRASAKRITAVCPFYGYARQDRKAEGREPISARLLADCITVAGADRVVTVDLHTGQAQGFFDFPVDHLTAVPLLAEHLAQRLDGAVTVVTPDAGGGKLMARFASYLRDHDIDPEMAYIDKRRPKGTHNVARAQEVVGLVKDRTCVLVDDMIDTAGTITSAAELLTARGATDVYVASSHGVLSGPAVERLANAPIREVVLTNTLPIPGEKQFDNLTVLSIAPIVAKALDAVFADTSVSNIFRGDNV